MKPRTEKIFQAILKEYIKTAEPVGSKILCERYNFSLSPATIRNEMKRLEKEEFIFQPHTSAGRVPTDKGYRHYVDSLMRGRELSSIEQKKVQTEFLKLQARYNRLSRTTSKLLSLLTQNMAISGSLDEKEVIGSGITQLLKQPEFAETSQVYEIAEALDWLDENIEDVMTKGAGPIDVFIGDENPTKHLNGCSMVVSRYRLPSGTEGFMAVVGPKRMRYSHTIPLVEFLSNYLNEGDY
ncbi:MAG: hypothetical protein ABIE68_01950 [bacterium]